MATPPTSFNQISATEALESQVQGSGPSVSVSNAAFSSAATDTTTASGYVNMANVSGAVSSFQFTKKFGPSFTNLKIKIALGAYSQGAGSTVIKVGVNIGGIDYDMFSRFINEAGTHKNFTAFRHIINLNAGTYTIQARWARVSGTGTLTRDQNDWLSILCEETPV